MALKPAHELSRSQRNRRKRLNMFRDGRGQHRNRLTGSAHPGWRGGKLIAMGRKNQQKREQRQEKRRLGLCYYDGCSNVVVGESKRHTACDIHRVQGRWYHRGRKYGLSYEQFEKLLQMQKWKCAICQCSIDELSHVDHDHAAQKVRGLLCGICNMGMGHFRDSVDLLRRAIAYLEKKMED